MVKHLYKDFLTDPAEYAAAARYWVSQWESVPFFERQQYEWRQPWFASIPPQDGNPIFTAVSEPARKAIRIIQYAPTSSQLEFDFWLDSFGGKLIDPMSIRELVIACALSVEASRRALDLMSQWTFGDIEYAGLETGLQTMSSMELGWDFSVRPAA